MQRRACVAQLENAARIRNRGLDLAAMAHDPRVTEQALDVAIAETRHGVRVEARERAAKVLPLAEDGQPREARLEALEAETLVEPALVRHRTTPLFVVVGDVERVARRPAAFPSRERRP